ncbi:MAG: hypothetical protein AAF442_04855 [Pseudomonadota bacterium]
MSRFNRQADLFAALPPKPGTAPVIAFTPAFTRRERIARAVADCLTRAVKAGKTRAQIAAEMSEALGGQRITKGVLDGYASLGRENNTITAERIIALALVTGDDRPIAAMLYGTGWTVVDDRYLGAIDLAEAYARRDAAREDVKYLTRRLRGGSR